MSETPGTTRTNTPSASRGMCVILCRDGEGRSFAPPPQLIEALESRGLTHLTLQSPTRVMSRLLAIGREIAMAGDDDRPLLFIACTDDPGSCGDLVEAIAAFLPRVVCRYIDPATPSRMTPFPKTTPNPSPSTNGTHAPSPGARLASGPELRLTGDAEGAANVTIQDAGADVDPGADAAQEPTTLTDEEMNMLLSDEWDQKEDRAQS